MPGPSLPKPLLRLIGGPFRAGGDAAPSGSSDPAGVKESALDGVEPGASLGPEGLLLRGLGFGRSDRRSALRNRVELANIARFLAEADPGKAVRKETVQTESTEASETRRGEAEASAPDSEAREAREQRSSNRAEERRDMAFAEFREVEPGFGAEPESAESARDKDSGGGRGEDEASDEDEGPGAGWLAEELEERERRRRFRVGGDVGLGPTHRCRGMLPDGSRCLRKPVDGTPFCREHR